MRPSHVSQRREGSYARSMRRVSTAVGAGSGLQLRPICGCCGRATGQIQRVRKSGTILPSTPWLTAPERARIKRHAARRVCRSAEERGYRRRHHAWRRSQGLRQGVTDQWLWPRRRSSSSLIRSFSRFRRATRVSSQSGWVSSSPICSSSRLCLAESSSICPSSAMDLHLSCLKDAAIRAP